MKLNCGVERHHYSMFNVGRSMFDVSLLILDLHLSNQPRMAYMQAVKVHKINKR